MKHPPYLRAGDEVAIVSPSFAIGREKVDAAVRVLESWQLRVRLGENICGSDGPFAGTDKERLKDVQIMMDDPAIKALLFARGGYGAIRIIDKIDFSGFMRSPKWLVGFSDITLFHLWSSRILEVESIHGEMPVNYGNSEKSKATFDTLHDALFGEVKPLFWHGAAIRAAEAEGEIIGGNLSLVYSLVGTPGDNPTDGKILFIEDIGEQYYHIDRMLVALKLAGKLSNLAALIVGAFNKMEDTTIPWGKTIEDIVGDVTAEYDYPVFFNFPAGHVNDNRAFYIGRKATVLSGHTLKF